MKSLIFSLSSYFLSWSTLYKLTFEFSGLFLFFFSKNLELFVLFEEELNKDDFITILELEFDDLIDLIYYEILDTGFIDWGVRVV